MKKLSLSLAAVLSCLLMCGIGGCAADMTTTREVQSRTETTPARDSWTELRPSGDVPDGRANASTADLTDGRAVVFGGFDGHVYLGDMWAYDPEPDAWVELTWEGAGPAPRARACLAWDSVGGTLILFGGYDGVKRFDDIWVYDFAVRSWTELHPTGRKPSARDGHSMTYEPVSRRAILFGGYDGAARLNDTWAYDLDANRWTAVHHTGPTPPRREGHAAVYDARNAQLVMFGGQTDGGYVRDVWIYDPAAGTWNERDPVGSLPPSRAEHAMVYDSDSCKVVIFGGSRDATLFSDTWTYNPAVDYWTELEPKSCPYSRAACSMVYDSLTGCIILFGGRGYTGALNDTWAYRPAVSSSDSLASADLPPRRSNHAMVYDPASRQAILFGGCIGMSNLGDTWAYYPRGCVWTDLAPDGDVPEHRSDACLVYDPTAGRVILFGGDRGMVSFDDTWAYESATNTWTELSPTGDIPITGRHYMFFDAKNQKIVLIGLWVGQAWAYDPLSNSWTASGLGKGAPIRRAWENAVYDPRSEKVVVFGGIDWAPAVHGHMNDTWLYDPDTNTWKELRPRGDLPSARRDFALVHDPGSGRILLFGGSDDNGDLSDLWAYDPKTNEWIELQPKGATPPERHGHSLVYDPDEALFILFGGLSDIELNWLNDTWAYDPAMNTWAELLPGGTQAQ